MFISEEVSERDKFRRKRIFLSLQCISCFSTKPKPSLLFSSFFNLSCVIDLFPSYLELPVKLWCICCTCLGVHRKKLGLVWCTNGLLPACWCTFQLDTSTQIVLIFQDTLEEDPTAGLDQGTTPCGDPLCCPAKYWSLRYTSSSVVSNVFHGYLLRRRMQGGREHRIALLNESAEPFR